MEALVCDRDQDPVLYSAVLRNVVSPVRGGFFFFFQFLEALESNTTSNWLKHTV